MPENGRVEVAEMYGTGGRFNAKAADHGEGELKIALYT
jgi:hypothetical protein